MDRLNVTELPIETRPRIALLAHDAKRDELVEVLREFMPELRDCYLVATHVTGAICSQRLDIDVSLVESSVRGGDMQIGAMVVEGKLDAIIYLRDALGAPPYAPDIAPLVRVCDVHGVPIDTNKASARAALSHLLGFTPPAQAIRPVQTAPSVA